LRTVAVPSWTHFQVGKVPRVSPFGTLEPVLLREGIEMPARRLEIRRFANPCSVDVDPVIPRRQLGDFHDHGNPYRYWGKYSRSNGLPATVLDLRLGGFPAALIRRVGEAPGQEQ